MRETPKRLSVLAYAKRRKVHHKTVQKAIERGHIAVGADGLLDVETADGDWENSINPAKAKKIVPRAEKLANARLDKETYAAKLARLKFEEKSGELVSAVEAERIWGNVISQAKTRLLAVPSKVRGRLPHLTLDDVAAMTEEIREALQGLSEVNIKKKSKEDSEE